MCEELHFYLFIDFNSLVKGSCFVLKGGDFVFVWFQEIFGFINFGWKQRLRNVWRLGCWVFLGRCWEVALSYGACWSEIEAILWKARVVICSSSDGRSGFVSKLPRNNSGFNCLLPLLGLKIGIIRKESKWKNKMPCWYSLCTVIMQN